MRFTMQCMHYVFQEIADIKGNYLKVSTVGHHQTYKHTFVKSYCTCSLCVLKVRKY